MINYDSILSAFDGKPTLLQWLKMVKKALDESVLKNVDITQNGEKVVFSFNFEDGTSISTPEVTLPKGDKGEKGNEGVGIVSMETSNSQVVGVNTESIIRVELSDGSTKQFKAYAKNGSNGNDGVSITGIDTVGNQVVGDETLTTLRARYSNDTTGDFVVTAKNGKSAEVAIYSHIAYLYDDSHVNYIYFKVYSNKQALTLNDIVAEIPTVNSSSLISEKRTYVSFNDSSEFGVVSAGKVVGTNGYYIYIDGVTNNGTNVKHTKKSFQVSGFGSQLLE